MFTASPPIADKFLPTVYTLNLVVKRKFQNITGSKTGIFLLIVHFPPGPNNFHAYTDGFELFIKIIILCYHRS